jgi:predicted transcriptional regulator
MTDFFTNKNLAALLACLDTIANNDRDSFSEVMNFYHRNLINFDEDPYFEKHAPAVPVQDSVTDDYIVCLEDGKKMKSLKRHLTKLGLSFDAYKRKWGLPKNYPSVCRNYSQKRKEIAKSLGLGTHHSRKK